MSRRIRVASFFRTLGAGGDEARLCAIARALDRRRFDHVVVVAFGSDPRRETGNAAMRAAYRDAGIEVVELVHATEPGAGSPPAHPAARKATTARAFGHATRELARFLGTHRIDVLDAHLAPAIPLAVVAGKLARTSVIVGTQYHWLGWDRPLRRALAHSIWPLLDTLVCDSHLRLAELSDFLVRPPPGVVIPNGILAPASERSAADMRRALALPVSPAVRVVGQVSRFVPFKGQGVLLSAAREVLARSPDTAFLFCGFEHDASYVGELRQRARAMGIAERVSIRGYPGPIADVWRAIDVHVHASLFDSSPISILEGMALGKPSVVTRVGGIPELVEHEATGLVVPPGEVAPLAAGILRLLGDRDESARFGQAALSRWRERHQPAAMARATEELFEALLARRGPAAS